MKKHTFNYEDKKCSGCSQKKNCKEILKNKPPRAQRCDFCDSIHKKEQLEKRRKWKLLYRKKHSEKLRRYIREYMREYRRKQKIKIIFKKSNKNVGNLTNEQFNDEMKLDKKFKY